MSEKYYVFKVTLADPTFEVTVLADSEVAARKILTEDPGEVADDQTVWDFNPQFDHAELVHVEDCVRRPLAAKPMRLDEMADLLGWGKK